MTKILTEEQQRVLEEKGEVIWTTARGPNWIEFSWVVRLRIPSYDELKAREEAR